MERGAEMEKRDSLLDYVSSKMVNDVRNNTQDFKFEDTEHYISNLIIQNSIKFNREYERRVDLHTLGAPKSTIPKMNKNFISNTLKNNEQYNDFIAKRNVRRAKEAARNNQREKLFPSNKNSNSLPENNHRSPEACCSRDDFIKSPSLSHSKSCHSRKRSKDKHHKKGHKREHKRERKREHKSSSYS